MFVLSIRKRGKNIDGRENANRKSSTSGVSETFFKSEPNSSPNYDWIRFADFLSIKVFLKKIYVFMSCKTINGFVYVLKSSWLSEKIRESDAQYSRVPRVTWITRRDDYCVFEFRFFSLWFCKYVRLEFVLLQRFGIDNGVKKYELRVRRCTNWKAGKIIICSSWK